VDNGQYSGALCLSAIIDERGFPKGLSGVEDMANLLLASRSEK
jgi:hypothetical protein